MRTYISPLQLDELSEKQKEKLREWYHQTIRKKALEIAKISAKSFLEQNPSSSATPESMFKVFFLYLPQFDISQLLEYLQQYLIEIQRSGDCWLVKIEHKDKIKEYIETELIDALWELTKQTLK